MENERTDAYFVFQSTFMSVKDQPLDSLQEVKDIRRLMENSSRFIYLSGLSGVAAGIIALAGAWYAQSVIFKDVPASSNGLLVLDNSEYSRFSSQLWLLAAAVFIVAFLLAYFFTWRKVTKQGVSIWNYSSRRLFWNMVLPLIAGGLFIYGMIQNGVWAFVAPACLIFYGLALVNASKYTLSDIRYLGYCEIVLGLINMLWLGYGLYYWALGFGVLHIAYGILMWWKYERQ